MTSSHLPMVIGFVICLTCLTVANRGSGLPSSQPIDETGHGNDQLQNVPEVGLETANSDGVDDVPEGQDFELTTKDSSTPKNRDRKHNEALKATVRKQAETLKLLRDGVQQQTSTMQQMSQRLDSLQSMVSAMPNGSANATITGVSYIRWGRTQCEGTAVPVYAGYAAGGATSDGQTNPICLTDNPVSGSTTGYTTVIVRAVEYYFHSDPFSAANSDTGDLLYENAPCVLCHVSNRSDTFMLPGHNSCPIGWTVEYFGYLVSTYSGYVASGPFMCLDDAPEAAVGGSANQNGFEVYAAIPDCGSLECPPYFSNQCIPCAVCTR